jgi:predicted DNA-binding transcriptional regulator AlpA
MRVRHFRSTTRRGARMRRYTLILEWSANTLPQCSDLNGASAQTTASPPPNSSTPSHGDFLAVGALRRSLTMVNPAPDKLDRLLRTRDAAKVVGLSRRTMESYRRNGGGPPFVKIRDYAVRYVLRDLLAWIAARKRTLTLDPNEEAIFVGKPDAT